MKRLLLVMCLALGVVVVAGCVRSRPAPDKIPAVTLVEKRMMSSRNSILMRFRFTHMDRVDWTGRLLKAQVLKSGDRPRPKGSAFVNPQQEFVIEVGLIKVPGSDAVSFVPRWGNSREGLITAADGPELKLTSDENDQVSLPGTADQNLSQFLQSCVAPEKTVPFDPDAGLELIVVGLKPNAYVLRVWTEKVGK